MSTDEVQSKPLDTEKLTESHEVQTARECQPDSIIGDKKEEERVEDVEKETEQEIFEVKDEQEGSEGAEIKSDEIEHERKEVREIEDENKQQLEEEIEEKEDEEEKERAEDIEGKRTEETIREGTEEENEMEEREEVEVVNVDEKEEEKRDSNEENNEKSRDEEVVVNVEEIDEETDVKEEEEEKNMEEKREESEAAMEAKEGDLVTCEALVAANLENTEKEGSDLEAMTAEGQNLTANSEEQGVSMEAAEDAATSDELPVSSFLSDRELVVDVNCSASLDSVLLTPTAPLVLEPSLQLKPLSEAQLKSLYYNACLENLEAIVDRFLLSCNQTSHEFYDLVQSYLRSLLRQRNKEECLRLLKADADRLDTRVSCIFCLTA